jgi:hypothetical protein
MVLILAAIVALFVMVPNVAALQDSRLGSFLNSLFSFSSDITITWQPVFGAMPITDLQVEEQADKVILTWVNSPVGTATMIRAKLGTAPVDISDGYQVYYGPDETVIDEYARRDDVGTPIIYRGWADTALGYSDPVDVEFRYVPMVLVLLVALLIALAFWRQTPALKIISGLVAIAFGAYWTTAVLNNYVYIASGVAVIIIGVYMIVTAWSKGY